LSIVAKQKVLLFTVNKSVFPIEIFIECYDREYQNKLRIMNNRARVRFDVLTAAGGAACQ
jgi:hypothetical protein